MKKYKFNEENQILKETTYSVTTVEDAQDAIANIVSLIYSKKNYNQANAILQNAIDSGLDNVFGYMSSDTINIKRHLKNLL